MSKILEFNLFREITLEKEVFSIKCDYNSFKNNNTFYVDYAIVNIIADKNKTKYD